MQKFLGTLKNPRNIILMALAIAINIAIGQLVTVLKLPIYLDSIGTVLVGALLGPWAGALTGMLASLIWGLLGNAYAAPYFIVALAIGLLAGIFGKRGVFTSQSPQAVGAVVGGLFFFALALFIITFINIGKDGSMPAMADLLSGNLPLFAGALIVGVLAGAFLIKNGGYAGLAGIATGVVAAVISAPISAYLFGGVSGSGTDVLVASFMASGQNILSSVLAQGVVSDPFDKMASFMMVWAIINLLPKRILESFDTEAD
jgi:energy-coupling factor transport system substrate-specific component